MITLQQRSHSLQEIGTLTVHKEKTFSQGNLLTLFCVLYVDNDTFPLEDRLQIEWGLSLIHNNFVKFGLEMHICGGRKASKTKCIFFPPPGFFNRNKIVSCEINGENTLCTRSSKHVKRESHENKFKGEESLYTTLTETKHIAVVDGNVTFCSHFNDLGSWISF